MEEKISFQLLIVNNCRKDEGLWFRRGVCEVLRCERKSSLSHSLGGFGRVWVGKCCSLVVITGPAWLCSNSKKHFWSFTKNFNQKSPSQSECATWAGLICLLLPCCCSFTFQGLPCLGDPLLQCCPTQMRISDTHSSQDWIPLGWS